MTRDELIRMLATAVAARLITEAEAVSVREAFDAGRLDASQLPNLERTPGITAADVATTATLLRAVLRGDARVRARHATGQLERFARTSAAIASDDLRTWHTGMITLVRTTLTAQYVLGYGGVPSDLAPLQAVYAQQLAYLHRFALQRAVAEGAGRPMSEAMIRARSQLYAGAGRELFYRGQNERLGPGWIVRYECRDDPASCFECLAAERASPFLPSQAVYPGSVCRGRAHCRCTLRAVYDPAAYQRLVRSA